MKKNTNVPLAYHFPWYQLPVERYESMLDEIASWGVQELVAPQYFHHSGDTRAGGFVGYMSRCASSSGMRFTAAHGLLGPKHDLGWADSVALEDHLHYLGDLASVGVQTVTLHSGTNQKMFQPVPPSDFWDRVRHAVEVLLPSAIENHVILALENIYEPRCQFEKLVGVVREFDHPLVRMCLDTGHGNLSDMGLQKVFQTVSPYVATCHLHDNHGVEDEHAAPGHGNVPWADIIPKLKSLPGLIHGETESREFSAQIWQDYQKLWQGCGA